MIAVAFVLAFATSAEAMSPAPLDMSAAKSADVRDGVEALAFDGTKTPASRSLAALVAVIQTATATAVTARPNRPSGEFARIRRQEAALATRQREARIARPGRRSPNRLSARCDRTVSSNHLETCCAAGAALRTSAARFHAVMKKVSRLPNWFRPNHPRDLPLA